jgi:LAGLIDADG endonuclease
MINNKLDPNWVTGFTDGEGCFLINIYKNNVYKTGWRIYACFQIKLHVRDKDLLLDIKSFFSEVGTVKTDYKYNFVVYKVYALHEIISTIIPHFKKYPLITKKQSDFIIFKNIVELMSKGQHLTKDGLIKIINFKASLNNGLSDKLKIYFPNIIKVERSKVNIPLNIDPNWVAGFFSGEGCFSVSIYKSKTHKVGSGIIMHAIVTQHSRDEILFNNIKNYFNCGYIYKNSTRNIVNLKISNFNDIYQKIIPLFNKYKIEGIKALDFIDFCKTAEIVKRKNHLTLEGLKEIQDIKSKMNKARYLKYKFNNN